MGLERSIQSHERQRPHPRLLYPAKQSFRMEGQIKCFPDKVKLKEFIITKPLLYEMLKGLIYEKEDKNMNSKMTTNSQLLTTTPKTKTKAKQTSRTGTEPQKWRSHGGLSSGRWRGESGGKGTGNKKHKW